MSKEPSPLLSLLNAQESFPKFYWYDPSRDLELIAWGSKEIYFSPPPQMGNWMIQVQDFFEKKRRSQLWEGFPPYFAFSPEVAIWKEKNKLSIEGSFTQPEKQQLTPLEFPTVLHIEHNPDKYGWEETIRNAVHNIRQGRMDKVVLARHTALSLSSNTSWQQVLQHLSSKSSLGIQFALEIGRNQAFVGMTPETLFRKEGLSLYTEAVAGTRQKNTGDLTALSHELLSSPKDLGEFLYVKSFLVDALSPFASQLKVGTEPEIKETANLIHLFNPIDIKLREDISNDALIHLLHPTPAVGGLPRENALKHIQQHELFDRGWYAAPIGISRGNFAHYAVAIRSALIKEKQMHLFAGTGIVADSSPPLEWQELESKIDPYQIWKKKQEN